MNVGLTPEERGEIHDPSDDGNHTPQTLEEQPDVFSEGEMLRSFQQRIDAAEQRVKEWRDLSDEYLARAQAAEQRAEHWREMAEELQAALSKEQQRAEKAEARNALLEAVNMSWAPLAVLDAKLAEARDHYLAECEKNAAALREAEQRAADARKDAEFYGQQAEAFARDARGYKASLAEMEQRAEKAEAIADAMLSSQMQSESWIAMQNDVAEARAEIERLRGIANEQIDSLLAVEAHAERLAARMLIVADELGEIQRDAGSTRLREQLSGIEGALRIDLRAYEEGKA